MKKLFTIIAFFSIFLSGCAQRLEICENQEWGRCLYSSKKVDKFLTNLSMDDDFHSNQSIPLQEQKELNLALIHLALVKGLTEGDESFKYLNLDKKSSNFELYFDEEEEHYRFFSLESEEKFFDYVKSPVVEKGIVFEKTNSFENGSLVFVEDKGEVFVFFALNKNKILGFFPNVGIKFGELRELKGDLYYFIPKYYKI